MTPTTKRDPVSHSPVQLEPGRRQANRTATLAAIKAAALAQVEHEGAAALSIRGVARAIGLSPAGMYRYYDGRDAVLTDLLVDAYDDMANAVAAAEGHDPNGDGDPLAGLLRAIEAYREWAVGNPTRFLLIFGTPVPGYEPPDDRTTVANRRMGAVFFALAARAWAAGLIAAPATAEPAQGEGDVLVALRAIAPDFPAALVPRMLAGWALWHGLVTLEVTGQLHWVYPDTAPYYSERMAAWLDGFVSGAPGA